MSTFSATKPTTADRVRLVAWAVVCLGATVLVALVANPLVGVATGLAVALLGLALNALGRASRTMDRIFEEELD